MLQIDKRHFSNSDMPRNQIRKEKRYKLIISEGVKHNGIIHGIMYHMGFSKGFRWVLQ